MITATQCFIIRVDLGNLAVRDSSLLGGQFACPKGHMSETYRQLGLGIGLGLASNFGIYTTTFPKMTLRTSDL